jgi:C-methyltransferase-like protein
MRHCLEGLLDVEPVTTALREAASPVKLYVEITDLDGILTERNPALFFHEYHQYFSARSLDLFLRQVGFRLQRVYPLHGNSNLGVTAVRAPATTDLTRAYDPLAAIVREHRRVVIWGVSGRAISLLCHLSWDERTVAFGVDIDPSRQGLHIPVTGQRVLSPEEAKAFAPDLVIVANAVYAQEIRAVVGNAARLVTLQGQLL